MKLLHFWHYWLYPKYHSHKLSIAQMLVKFGSYTIKSDIMNLNKMYYNYSTIKISIVHQ